MNDAVWVQLASAVALVVLMAYAVLGGADFGGGIWDLFATGPRKAQQRRAIARAMGPVWEANHVWLIFLIVLLFTCFPHGYAALATAMFLPFHLALLGIMLRGAAFVFRGFTTTKTDQAIEPNEPQALPGPGDVALGDAPLRLWGSMFGIASVISPVLLGAAFGVLTAGEVLQTADGYAALATPLAWLGPYPVGCGLLALSTCAYLAAVYLMAETTGPLREDFRRRAIIGGTTTALLAAAVLLLARWQADWFFHQLLSLPALPVVALGLLLFAASAWAVFAGRPYWSRVFAAGQVIVMLLGWGLAHREYLVYPDFTFADTAAPIATIKFLLLSLVPGAILVAPSLWLLFKIFSQPEETR